VASFPWKTFALGAAAGGAVAVAALVVGLRAFPSDDPPRAAAPPPSKEYPGGRPIDAAQIASGRVAMERMPHEVTSALELHSAEIVKTAEAIASRQARITGTCAPGSAIRVVGEDGSVTCQRLPRGVVSVSALAGVARQSSTGTAQGAVKGAVGRYQTSGDDDFLVIPLHLPDGALVTSFSYTFYDHHPTVDGSAYLYRSDDVVLAAVQTEESSVEVRTVRTESIQNRKIENEAYAYFVYLQLSPEAGPNLMPISAAVGYRLP
jgi:hypothetical protein